MIWQIYTIYHVLNVLSSVYLDFFLQLGGFSHLLTGVCVLSLFHHFEAPEAAVV